ncbi:sodium:solute symporter family protein [Thalassotalea crassostreae]|uniref:sodium:solute symporter family protein n=1 Tax=Thalassotalea crassostreae TaxID=1763536 RepID=UPI001D04B39E|nr:sodium:solute symporter family protein [Thalassotalea crassostreae]
MLIFTGFYLKRKASKNINAYFMGERKLPWYALSLSNASGMFDISGTMWLVTLTFVYGLKSIWIPWLWPVFNQIFLMVFLSLWLRRSNVMTGAEWITFRFGDRFGGKLSFNIVVIFAIVSVLGFLTYGFIGLGKFTEIFIPWSVIDEYVPFTIASDQVAYFYGAVLTIVMTSYVLMGGMLGIVWADVIQFFLMLVATIIIAITAMNSISPEMLAAVVPDGWDSPWFSWQLSLDWQESIPQVNQKIAEDGYELFGIFFILMLFKGYLVSAAGPAPNKDMQKILSARSPKEAALMSGFVSVVLMPIRYILITSFAILAIVFFEQLPLHSNAGIDFENILPAAIIEFTPIGLLGLVVASLIAAFISTFAGSVNAAVAYMVNDIYKRQINPAASERRLVNLSYLSVCLIVLVSIVIGCFVENINNVMQWIVSGLWGGYVVTNILKWYWWRLNGYGYFWGMLAGMLGALILPLIIEGVDFGVAKAIVPLYLFPALLIFSGAICIAVSLSTPPVDSKVLINFYKKTRPWGFWKPIKDLVLEQEPTFKVNTNFYRDMFNVVLGIIFQTCLVLMAIQLVVKQFSMIWITGGILIISCIGLKKFWYNNLEN